MATPAWESALLVCRDCRKRSNGPRDLKPKALAVGLKRAVREERPRPRVLLTNCLGLCPKRATAVARVGSKGGEAVESRLEAATSVEGAIKVMLR